jgi:predicted TIM-barrel fold metal-dependent hydrolase
MHVHFGAPGDPEQGDPYYWSKEFTQSVAYKAFRLVTGTWLTKLDYEKIKKHLIRFNNPKYLRAALDKGVTVIIPHCTLPFPPQDLATFDPYQNLLTLIKEPDPNAPIDDWPLYIDLSALLLFRNRYIPDVLQNIPARRMLFGSDYPIPMSDLAYKKDLSFWDWLQRFFRSLFEPNLLDKNYYLLQDMGFDALVFTNVNDVFSKIIRGGS